MLAGRAVGLAKLEVKRTMRAAGRRSRRQDGARTNPLAGPQAEERGREEIRQALAAQKRSEELADELERALI